MVVEHDLAILDKMADQVNLVYGSPGAYGVITKEKSTNKAINAFLSGYLREENVRVRPTSIDFTVKSSKRTSVTTKVTSWTAMEKSYGSFNLNIGEGYINREEIIGVLGQNALGKTTFVKILSGVIKPDFGGDHADLDRIIAAEPDVIAHNIETVRRLTPSVRDPRAGYDQTLSVLKYIKSSMKGVITKSSIMVGLGETDEEVEETMMDLRNAGVEILTVGQYLRPTKKQLAVVEYSPMSRFKHFEEAGYKMGFSFVASGPLVRTSSALFNLFILGRFVVSSRLNVMPRSFRNMFMPSLISMGPLEFPYTPCSPLKTITASEIRSMR